MGTSVSEIRKGDHICYLFGDRVAFVLRQEVHFWKIVGSAFVYEFENVSSDALNNVCLIKLTLRGFSMNTAN